MAVPEILHVDPKTLRLPPSRESGADAFKLARQIGRYGSSVDGLPRVFAFRAADGELVVFDGVTRATRVAKLVPGYNIEIEVIGSYRGSAAYLPTIGDRLS